MCHINPVHIVAYRVTSRPTSSLARLLKVNFSTQFLFLLLLTLTYRLHVDFRTSCEACLRTKLRTEHTELWQRNIGYTGQDEDQRGSIRGLNFMAVRLVTVRLTKLMSQQNVSHIPCQRGRRKTVRNKRES
jgi:hypothetical protein